MLHYHFLYLLIIFVILFVFSLNLFSLMLISSLRVKTISLYFLLKNTPVKAEISRDQEDWFNSLEEELTQVQEDLSFYNNILEEFMAENIISLELNSRGDTTQESSAVITTADAMTTADITAGAIILDDADVANDSCVWRSD